jgi:hypothetical protein
MKECMRSNVEQEAGASVDLVRANRAQGSKVSQV